jgi:hypothetical protein
MPTPVYIICCESGTEDKFTGLASHFNVVDRIVAKKPPPSGADSNVPIIPSPPPLRIVAVWRADDDSDFEGIFQSEVIMRLMPKDEIGTLYSDTFSFLRERYKHRITVILGGLRVEESGKVIVESRIRRPDESKWLTQSYIIDVVVNTSEQPEPPAAESGDSS